MDNILTPAEIFQYQIEGFVVKNVLAPEDVSRYLDAIKSARPRSPNETPKMANIQFLQPETAIRGIHSIITNLNVSAVCRDVLGGGDIVLDGASLFCGERGIDYRQRWHRDVMQLHDEDILDSWFAPDHFHNNIQVNIPLLADSCLWLVKGSQARPFTNKEQTLFRGSRKTAPIDDTDEPIGDQFLLHPGEAIFYNNLTIHRGYGGVLAEDRMTIHLGFHSSRADPTYHFGTLDYREYTDEYLQGLDANVRQTLQMHISHRRAWGEDSDVFLTNHRKFLESTFQVK
jgi:ectoine hydroxylase-related dioxygenase (phytanoyl-CoA dioxygenase family)